MIPFDAGIDHKYQQIQQIIREKAVVAFYEQPSQTVLPNQLVGGIVQLLDTRFFIDKQRILLNALADKERNALNQISNSYGENFSRSTFFSSVRDADMKLDDNIDMRTVREYAYQQRRQKQQQRNRKPHELEK